MRTQGLELIGIPDALAADTNYHREPTPPLEGENAVWVEELLDTWQQETLRA